MFTEQDVRHALRAFDNLQVDQEPDHTNGLVLRLDAPLGGPPSGLVIRIFTRMTKQAGGVACGPICMEVHLADGTVHNSNPMKRASLTYRVGWEYKLADKVRKLSEEAAIELAWRKHKNGVPACPDCQSRMVLRKSRVGSREFWGCTRYPGCRGMRYVYADITDYAPLTSPEALGLTPEDMPHGAAKAPDGVITSLVAARRNNSNWE